MLPCDTTSGSLRCESRICGSGPRTELLPCDTRWWEFNDDTKWSVVAVALGLIGILYVSMGIAGLRQIKQWTPSALLLIFLVLRSLFLGSLENPEPRYTLEAYPVVFVFAAAFLGRNKKELTEGGISHAKPGPHVLGK